MNNTPSWNRLGMSTATGVYGKINSASFAWLGSRGLSCFPAGEASTYK